MEREQIVNALVNRLRKLSITWRAEAVDTAVLGPRATTLNMCARQVELLLEELGLERRPARGSTLRPHGGSMTYRVCAFRSTSDLPCDERGPIWNVVYYDRAVIDEEPFNGTELNRVAACFVHGAAEQKRIRELSGEDR